ncbi:MAG: hypothetical protein M0021_11530 [Clostridia bacterium]|nr:hypothetical protein [Clostridia bacterium]
MAGRWFGLVAVAIIGVLLGGGFKLFMTLNPFAGPNQPQVRSSPEVQRPAEPKAPETTAPAEEPPKEQKTSIPEAKTDEGEIVVEGMVDNVSIKKRTIKFTQEMDDTSKKVNPRVKVLKDAVIEVNGKQTDFAQITVGDYVTMILDANHQARAVQIER